MNEVLLPLSRAAPDHQRDPKQKMAASGVMFMQPKVLKWEDVSRIGVQKSGILKTKGKKEKSSWSEYFFVLHFNYLIFYKPKKKNEPGPKDEPKGVIPLEQASGQVQRYDGDKSGFGFQLTTSDGTYYFCASSLDELKTWLIVLQGAVDRIKAAAPRENLSETERKLEEAKKTFRENNMKCPKTVNAQGASDWLMDMKKYKEEYKNCGPYINGLLLFAEFHNEEGEVSSGGMIKYLKWFSSKATGVYEQILQSEKSVMENWREQISNAPNKGRAELDNVFFIEDSFPIIEAAEQMKKLIDVYNDANRFFNGEERTQYGEIKTELETITNALKVLPSVSAVGLGKYDGGSIKGGDSQMWIYDKFEGKLKRENLSAEVMEPVLFDISKSHVFVSQAFGLVIWNNKSWAWTHPQCPFILRFEWDETRKVFKQFVPKVPPKDKPMAPALSDWQFVEGGIRSVVVGNRNPKPEVPPITFWQIKGNLPPPIVLLVVNFNHFIRPTVKDLFAKK